MSQIIVTDRVDEVAVDPAVGDGSKLTTPTSLCGTSIRECATFCGSRRGAGRVFHIEDPLVALGDRVEAGEKGIARSARQLAFESQIGRFTETHRGQALPHVHIEMKASAAARETDRQPVVRSAQTMTLSR